MAIGDTFSSPMVTYTDVKTGVLIKRLTSGRYNTGHIYFTNNSLYDHGTKIVVCSDANDSQNYFSYDLVQETMTQITDLPKLPFPETHRLYEGIVDGKNNRLYFFCKDDLVAIDLMTLEQKVIYTKPADYEHHVVSTCDGSQYVYTTISESAALKNHSFTLTKDEDYILPEPDSYILRIRADGSGYDKIFHDKKWLAHVNVCPTDENKITFCHEGRWEYVDHRIWGMDVTDWKIWKITDLPGYQIGHEYWYADGKRIGFHGEKDRKMIGFIDFENTNMDMIEFDYQTMHAFSLGEQLIVGDGDQNDFYLRLWRRIGNEYEEPRALCMHGCTFKTQSAHVHPRFLPDGKSILYTSDMGGYEQVYIVDLPDIETLPFLKDVL